VVWWWQGRRGGLLGDLAAGGDARYAKDRDWYAFPKIVSLMPHQILTIYRADESTESSGIDAAEDGTEDCEYGESR